MANVEANRGAPDQWARLLTRLPDWYSNETLPCESHSDISHSPVDVFPVGI